MDCSKGLLQILVMSKAISAVDDWMRQLSTSLRTRRRSEGLRKTSIINQNAQGIAFAFALIGRMLLASHSDTTTNELEASYHKQHPLFQQHNAKTPTPKSARDPQMPHHRHSLPPSLSTSPVYISLLRRQSTDPSHCS